MLGLAQKLRKLKKAKRADIADSLLLPETLEDRKLNNFASSITYLICVFLLLFLFWLSIAEFKELVIAQGQIEPSGLIKNIHHVEGGQVGKVHVREGDLIEAGTTLVSLTSIGSEQDLKQLETRKVYLSLNQIRLDSLLHDKKPDFSNWIDLYPTLVQNQIDQYKTTIRKRTKTQQIHSSKIAQYNSEYKAALLEHQSEVTRVDLMSKKLHIRQQLKKNGYASLRSVIETKSELQLAKSRSILSKGKIEKTHQLLKQAELKLAQVNTEHKDQLYEKYSEISREILELDETIKKFSDRVNRLKITSPYRGIIQKMSVISRGEVIPPAGLVANIVSVGDDMVAEVKFAPKDRAQFDVGHTAEIKVTSYDTNIFGSLSGTVKSISASIFRDEKGNPYYKAYITLNRNFFQKNDHKHFILPGMQVRAEIVTGAKSLMTYILKPVYRSVNQAFTEK